MMTLSFDSSLLPMDQTIEVTEGVDQLVVQQPAIAPN